MYSYLLIYIYKPSIIQSKSRFWANPKGSSGLPFTNLTFWPMCPARSSLPQSAHGVQTSNARTTASQRVADWAALRDWSAQEKLRENLWNLHENLVLPDSTIEYHWPLTFEILQILENSLGRLQPAEDVSYHQQPSGNKSGSPAEL